MRGLSGSDLIRRIERDEVRGLTAYGEGFLRLHGSAGRGLLREDGWIVVVLGENLPINRAIGIGCESKPDHAQIERAEVFMQSMSVAPEIEVTDASHDLLAPLLETRGYIKHQEFMWYMRSASSPDDRTAQETQIEEVAGAEPWVRVTSLGFDDSDDGEATLANRMLSETTAAQGVQRFLARLDGEPAGGAAMATYDGHAMLFSASTLPRFRRRGVQRALLGRRIQVAAQAGCDLITVKVEPGSHSERNVLRAGFEAVCAKASWRKASSGP